MVFFPLTSSGCHFDPRTQNGVEPEFHAARILSTFGLRSQSFWWLDLALLGIFFVGFAASSFVVLYFFMCETR